MTISPPTQAVQKQSAAARNALSPLAGQYGSRKVMRSEARRRPSPALNRKSGKSIQVCPAAIDFDRRHFVIPCPVDLTLAFVRDAQGRLQLTDADGEQSGRDRRAVPTCCNCNLSLNGATQNGQSSSSPRPMSSWQTNHVGWSRPNPISTGFRKDDQVWRWAVGIRSISGPDRWHGRSNGTTFRNR